MEVSAPFESQSSPSLAGCADSVVSIVIPTRDRCALLEETLNSIELQTFPYWEAIVVDDGSTDGTAQMVQRFCDRDVRFKWVVRQTDQISGGSSCRNIGLTYSNSEYVVFLDSDDLIAPECLKERVKYANSCPKLDFVVFQAELFKQFPGDLRLPFSLPSAEADLDRILRLDHPWQTSAPIWRTESLRRIGAFDASLPSYQDWELHLRAICNGLNYQKVNVCDYYVRGHSSSQRTNSLQRRDRRHLDAAITLFRKVYDELQTSGNMNHDRKLAIEGLAYLTAIRFVYNHGLNPAIAAWWRAYRCGLTGITNFLLGVVVLAGLRPAWLNKTARRTLLKGFRLRINLCKTT